MKRKWRENEEMEREIHSQDFLILCLFPPSLSISYIKNCHILSQNVKYGTFVANVTKNLTYALWGNNSGSNSLRGSSASCAGLQHSKYYFYHQQSWYFECKRDQLTKQVGDNRLFLQRLPYHYSWAYVGVKGVCWFGLAIVQCWCNRIIVQRQCNFISIGKCWLGWSFNVLVSAAGHLWSRQLSPHMDPLQPLVDMDPKYLQPLVDMFPSLTPCYGTSSTPSRYNYMAFILF